MTRWLRANGFPDERIVFEIMHIRFAKRYAQQWRRAVFFRVYENWRKRILAYSAAAETENEAVSLFWNGVSKRFGSSAAELEVRFAVLGQDAVGRLLDPGESPRQGLV